MKTIWYLLLLCVAAASTTARAQVPPGRDGGFQVGDRIQLSVEGDSLFTGTFRVGPGPALAVPVIGEIALVGVQRANIEAYLTRQLARYLKSPVVHAKALVNLSIIGEVTQPGFYSVPTDVVLGDALMQAGGPTREAKVPAMRIERDGKALLDGDTLQRAFAHALTVDQVGLRDGDRIVVPRATLRDPDAKWRILGILVTIPAAVYGITRLAH
jgi:polysaccharide biosynthesis/export protein